MSCWVWLHIDRLTVSVNDIGSLFIFEISTGGQRPFKIPIPSARFGIIADRPGAAALYYERVVQVVVRYIIGWDDDAHRPLEYVVPEQVDDRKRNGDRNAGGMFGRTCGYMMATETQGRGTLHAHILIWTKTASNVIQRLTDIQHIVQMHSRDNEPSAAVDAAAAAAAAAVATASAAPGVCVVSNPPSLLVSSQLYVTPNEDQSRQLYSGPASQSNLDSKHSVLASVSPAFVSVLECVHSPKSADRSVPATPSIEVGSGDDLEMSEVPHTRNLAIRSRTVKRKHDANDELKRAARVRLNHASVDSDSKGEPVVNSLLSSASTDPSQSQAKSKSRGVDVSNDDSSDDDAGPTTNPLASSLEELLSSAYTTELTLGDALIDEMHKCTTKDCTGSITAQPECVLSQLRYVFVHCLRLLSVY